MTTTIFPAPGSRKSLQSGAHVANGTAITIAQVNPAKSILKVNGWQRGLSNPAEARARILSATSIVGQSSDNASIFEWVLEEFY